MVLAVFAGFLSFAQPAAGQTNPPVPTITREEVERAPPPEQDPRRFSSRRKHSLNFGDDANCTVELAHETGRKVIVDQDGIEIRDDRPPAHADQPDAPTGADVSPVNSCPPRR
jgi:hypothetical protein